MELGSSPNDILSAKIIFFMNNLHLATQSTAGKMQSTIMYHCINCSAGMSNALSAWLCQSPFRGQPYVIAALSQFFGIVFLQVSCCCPLGSWTLPEASGDKNRASPFRYEQTSIFIMRLAIFYTTEHAQSFGELSKREEVNRGEYHPGSWCNWRELENSLDGEVLGKHEKPLYPRNYCTKTLFPGVWLIW